MKITIEIEEGDYEGIIKFMEHILMCGEEETEETETGENVVDYFFTNPVFEQYADAANIRVEMDKCMNKFGYVTVADLKDLSAPYPHTNYMSFIPKRDDYDYGWYKPFIQTVEQFPIKVHDCGGYFIDLPEPRNVLHAHK